VRAATGFTLIWQGTPAQKDAAGAALSRALAHFPEMKTHQIEVGETTLSVWGRGDLDDCNHILPDRSVLVLVGSPVGLQSWNQMDEAFGRLSRPADFRLPWDGRIILLRISPDGKEWMVWNDWLGSVPVFYATFPRWRIASTLEPVVVGASGFSSDDIFLPGLLLLLTHGNLLSNCTLYREMRTIPPDSVSIQNDQGDQFTACRTIQATNENWETGWNELVEEMHSLVKAAILETLKTQPEWIVPLSSGLDSRLIAAVGAAAGARMQTFTWGPPNTKDSIFSRRIARALNLPWQRIDLGQDYLARDVQLWADLFGSSMHFHGMYQIPFLKALKDLTAAPIASGLIGECLAGYDVRFQAEQHHSGQRQYISHPAGYIFWQVEQLKHLFKIPIDDALEEVADLIASEKQAVDGPWFQRLRFLTLWGRQNHFTYFQSMLSEYFRGVATPYLNRAYARFCLSLPRALLDERHLQIEMLGRYYSKVMSIGGTYAPEPAILVGSYLLKRRLAKALPASVSNRLLPEFAASKNIKTDITSLRACGETGIWPIHEKAALLAKWMDMDQIRNAYAEAIAGDISAIRKLQSIQTFAYRL
jgi:hypothetical protein